MRLFRVFFAFLTVKSQGAIMYFLGNNHDGGTARRNNDVLHHVQRAPGGPFSYHFQKKQTN
jgi:hypothetical protein